MRQSEKVIVQYRRSLFFVVAMILVVLPIEVAFVLAGKVVLAMVGATALLSLLVIGYGCVEDVKYLVEQQQQDQLARSARAAAGTETLA